MWPAGHGRSNRRHGIMRAKPRLQARPRCPHHEAARCVLARLVGVAVLWPLASKAQDARKVYPLVGSLFGMA